MKKQSPRKSYLAALGFAAVLLLVFGTVCHARAFRLRRREISDRIDALETRISTVERVRDVVADRKNAVQPTGGKSFLQSDDVRPALPRPRILGSGRSGRYVYMDVRLPSSQVNRYYLPADASPRDVKRWVAGLVADVHDDLSAVGW